MENSKSFNLMGDQEYLNLFSHFIEGFILWDESGKLEGFLRFPN